MNKPDLSHLNFLSKTDWGQTHLKDLLYMPHMTLWGSLSSERFLPVFESLKEHLKEEQGLVELIELNLITAWLLQAERLSDWFTAWLQEHIDVDDYLTDIEWRDCRFGRWHAVPVLLVHDRAYVRYFVFGLMDTRHEQPLWPAWADPLMDQTTKTAILSAAAACNRIHPHESGQGFYGYPLTIPNRRVQFTQGSLGLPLALGFLKLLTGKKAFDGLAATGSVNEDGAVQQAGHLSQKIRHAGANGFTAFLVPAAKPAPSAPQMMEVMPVSSLLEAWMFSDLYTPGKGKELVLMAGMLEDPRVFVNNCDAVPLEWLLWAKQNGRTHSVMDALLELSEVFEDFIDKLGICLAKGDLARGEVLAKLINPEAVKKKIGVAPLSVFKWFTLNLSIANHRGDIATAEMWGTKADKMVEKTSVSDAEAFANFYNHRFIGLCHNRYHFDPELPDYLKAILNALEGQSRSQRQLVENATNESLGALSGSIVQNYGFCGPEYLVETRRYSLLSREAFGDGRVPELKNDWLRQLNYLAYAELDTGNLDAAEKTLVAYMEIERWGELWSKMPGLSQWHHALLARFFADSEERGETRKYADWSLKNKGRILPQEHPWQLWLYNMGRVSYSLGDTRNASEFYNGSLALCLTGTLGPTVQVMALLPLSGLWQAGGLTGSEIDPTEKRIRRSAEGLNPDYFRLLLDESNFTRTLEKIWAQPEELFPFTYR